jgi:hypothetical protein
VSAFKRRQFLAFLLTNQDNRLHTVDTQRRHRDGHSADTISMFQPGQLVQCVDARDAIRRYGPIARGFKLPLVVGRIYTVTEVVQRLLPSRYGLQYGVKLAEVSCPIPGCAGFSFPRFRPLDDDRLEVFRRIARAAPVHITEEA